MRTILYAALDWLVTREQAIEQRFYQTYVQRTSKQPLLVVSDVTSSYLEGEHHELGAFDYDRDGKRSRKQSDWG